MLAKTDYCNRPYYNDGNNYWTRALATEEGGMNPEIARTEAAVNENQDTAGDDLAPGTLLGMEYYQA